MGATEWIATMLGLACVALAARRSVWTFSCGIASVTLLGVVVFEARLYSDTLLQAFFVVANVYGWLNWSRSTDFAGDVPVTHMSASERLRWTAGTLIASLTWATLVHRFTDASYPVWDALIAGASVAAQILMARRRIEHWWVWIAVDVASVPLYLAKGLYLFAALYLLYLALSVWGLIDWRRAERATAQRATG
ncbi:nicotinamide riboside transporter PnuC [Sphingomonas sp. Mn802worker]|uniref:nicotinamide riboside transporter PnuC n=1 Tax=Sphingomonas sp. Mn802worker TaxID=629773 RepID=UPI00037B1B4C|nr:nicotinamide riboside transporter PnuC [Sphingomonas sp. Mn802worker]